MVHGHVKLFFDDPVLLPTVQDSLRSASRSDADADSGTDDGIPGVPAIGSGIDPDAEPETNDDDDPGLLVAGLHDDRDGSSGADSAAFAAHAMLKGGRGGSSGSFVPFSERQFVRHSAVWLD